MGENKSYDELVAEASNIESRAWSLIKPFDDAAEKDGDRRVAYAALIIILRSFIKSSPMDAGTIFNDFAQRVMADIDRPSVGAH